MHERAAEGELLLHAPGQRRRAPRLERLELTVDRRDLFVFSLDRRPEHGREEPKILLHAQVGVEREATGHVADLASKSPQIFYDVASEHARLTSVGNQERRENAKERRFAGAVGADEAEQLARRDRERHVLDRNGRVESLGQPLGDNGGGLAHFDAVTTPNWRSAGMPILRNPSGLGTRTLIA
jgi:hypothetical protein